MSRSTDIANCANLERGSRQLVWRREKTVFHFWREVSHRSAVLSPTIRAAQSRSSVFSHGVGESFREVGMAAEDIRKTLFAPLHSPVRPSVKAREFENWRARDGVANTVPPSQ